MYQKLFYTDFTQELCSDEHMLQLMLNVELALMNAQEQNDIIPKGSSDTLQSIIPNTNFDKEKLRESIPLTGNAAAPFVKQLIKEVKQHNTEIAKYIHLGATSQDIIDTAIVLKIKTFSEWLAKRLAELNNILLKLTKENRQTIMIGRTLMQQARPISFALKTALWLQAIQASKKHLHFTEQSVLCIQLGGAVGSQNQYLTKEVRASFAHNLGLKNTPNWHTQRANIVRFASTLGILSNSIGKIAKDIMLLSQTEVGEVFESAVPGRGTSSTMPHKRNPVLSTAILANAHRIPYLVASMMSGIAQAHERSAGLWHAEWETLDDIIGLAAGSVEKAIELLSGLEVNKNRMLQNIELTKGLVFAESVALALAKKIGKTPAHQLVKEACQKSKVENIHLREVLAKMDFNINEKELEDLFKPENAIGKSLEIIDEILNQK